MAVDVKFVSVTAVHVAASKHRTGRLLLGDLFFNSNRESFGLICFRKTKSSVPRVTYRVYVVELSKRVFTEDWKFRAANPQFNGVLECLYVGMTSKTPAERFKQHKTGYINKKGYKLSAYIVQKYGTYLRPSLYDHHNLKPMTRQQALLMEKKLALDLRRKGYAVWFN